jgi:hypothetical protein
MQFLSDFPSAQIVLAGAARTAVGRKRSLWINVAEVIAQFQEVLRLHPDCPEAGGNPRVEKQSETMNGHESTARRRGHNRIVLLLVIERIRQDQNENLALFRRQLFPIRVS